MLTGTGTGNQAGSETLVNNSSNGTHYGQINSLTGTGSGLKIASYNYVDLFAGGTQYGVYSYAAQPTGYAGYFSGNVFVSGVFTNPSDSTLKENIVTTASVLSRLNSLVVKDYSFKKLEANKYGFPRGQQTGFIAQEMEKIFPNLVKEETLLTPKDATNISGEKQEERKIKSINYIGLIPILTKAIQEQETIITKQESKIQSLEDKIKILMDNQKVIEKRLMDIENNK